MPTLIIRTSKDGKTTTKVEGVKGAACKKVTAPLEPWLGEIKSVEPTGEMLETTVDTSLQIEQS